MNHEFHLPAFFKITFVNVYMILDVCNQEELSSEMFTKLLKLAFT